MMSAPRRVWVATLAAVTIVTGFGAHVPSAAAIDPTKGQPGFCRTNIGVTVVVDFQQLGGETIVRCFPTGTRATGLEALEGAGFQIAGVQRWGKAFICRIENRPSAVETVPIVGNPDYRERCLDTPPAAAFWSYWQAGNNCSWQFSQWGVKNRDAIPGGFEGWSFSLNTAASSNPVPRVAPVRPGTESHTCAAANETPRPSDTPDANQPALSATTAVPPARPPRSGSDGAARPKPTPAPAVPTTGGSPHREPSDSTGDEAQGSGGQPAASTTEAAPGHDPDHNVAFTGGENAEDIDDVLLAESDANPWAPWAAGGVVCALVVACGALEWRRRQARDG